ncbi:NAD-dependent epimerase/dehydratase family protein [Hugenholtzia roseola]|uniref:NAD-dependent epimerase/dehydratase family protein n=1 Tax=Hugenholtzia roseola TaxID=1002 RepID=UPI00042895F1|nr:NAD-dependent epimerase/dehydratase family protein [Hugenholtzia roseola]
MKEEKILVIGANGQLGTELTKALQTAYKPSQVIATDIRPQSNPDADTCFEVLDVLDKEALTQTVRKHKITQIYHLAAILSAKGEENPILTWDINMKSLLHVLELARERQLDKVYYPSSIAVYGTKTPIPAPQWTVLNPSTVYGISKLAGEKWCDYYFQKYGLDVRSLRYPGLISHSAPPGGGTTDYAVDIFHKAVRQEPFACFLSENTRLPMMYMPDAIRATLELMHAPAEKITIHSSYNLGAIDFTPAEIAQAVKALIPEFEMHYQVNPLKQAIADSWADAIDDQVARQDWGWKPEYDLKSMVADMIANLKAKIALQA